MDFTTIVSGLVVVVFILAAVGWWWKGRYWWQQRQMEPRVREYERHHHPQPRRPLYLK